MQHQYILTDWGKRYALARLWRYQRHINGVVSNGVVPKSQICKLVAKPAPDIFRIEGVAFWYDPVWYDPVRVTPNDNNNNNDNDNNNTNNSNNKNKNKRNINNVSFDTTRFVLPQVRLPRARGKRNKQHTTRKKKYILYMLLYCYY